MEANLSKEWLELVELARASREDKEAFMEVSSETSRETEYPEER